MAAAAVGSVFLLLLDTAATVLLLTQPGPPLTQLCVLLLLLLPTNQPFSGIGQENVYATSKRYSSLQCATDYGRYGDLLLEPHCKFLIPSCEVANRAKGEHHVLYTILHCTDGNPIIIQSPGPPPPPPPKT